MSQTELQNEKLIEEIWGEHCIECDTTEKPQMQFFSLKTEEIAVLSCSKCDFTIVVVDMDKLTDEKLSEELNDQNNSIIATYPSY
ncbi:MAG: hypothetical protein ACFFDW_00040 [Candidatus Thorarchaeota archaeon]